VPDAEPADQDGTQRDQSDGAGPQTVVETPPELDVAALVEKIEASLLGGSPRYTRGQVLEQTGLDADEARLLWRALGFASVDDDDVVFTDEDIEALRGVRRLTGDAPIDDEMLHAMTRVLGQTFARLAAWQGQMVLEVLASAPEVLESPQTVHDMVTDLVAVLGDLQNYVWRRQLAAVVSRIASGATTALGAEQAMAVGFADLAQFTSFTRRSSEDELLELLEAFEGICAEVVAEHHGRIVKTIGDEILFVAGSAAEAAGIALDLIDAAQAHPALPPLRIGVAAGPVVARLGDVYGSTVNIASRLTSLCRPGSVLVDRVMADELGTDPRFSLRARRPESVRGYQHLRQWRLRRGDLPSAVEGAPDQHS
jgi:adenylate cyclase